MTNASFRDDLAAEGEPEKEFNPGIASRLPRKTTAGGALIRNREGLILFLEPTYKPTLEIPGGVAEQNESPLDACRREVREEIGLDIEIGGLLVVDWVPAQGVWFDGLMFIFDGGVLGDDQIAQIKTDPSEASGYEFMTLERASESLRPSMTRRLAAASAALGGVSMAYAEFGRPASSGLSG